MPLPKIDHRIFDIEIPSLKEKMKFRAFLVKEEKILLIASESGEEKDIMDATKQIINNCVQQELNVDKLSTFDVEYIFLKLRAKSVNNISKLSYRDVEDEKIYNFDVDLDKLEITYTEGHSNKIKITDDITMQMRYPTVDITDDFATAKNEVEVLDKLVMNSIDKIYDADTVYEDYTEEELVEFMDQLNPTVYDQIKIFFDTMPKLYHKLEYTNANGSKRVIELKSLTDFFPLG